MKQKVKRQNKSTGLGILDQIVKRSRESVKISKRQKTLSDLKSMIRDQDSPKGFEKALKSNGDIRLVCEIKRQSPSKGIIRKDFDPVSLAQSFEVNNASAISVLTEPFYFGGAPEFLSLVKKSVDIPVLRKDFIFDPYQIYESRALGADAVLLIVSILDGDLLRELIFVACELGLDPLVEVHDEEELEIALQCGAQLIGINNRDLKTFHVDINTSLELAKKIPARKTIVSASGIKTHKDIETLLDVGIYAFLIGEGLMEAQDISSKMKEYFGK